MENVVNITDARSQKIQWSTVVGVTAFHLAAIGAFFTFSWKNFAAFMVTWIVANSWGIGLGYHRLLTHRGFKTPRWLEYTLTLFGTLALQSGAVSWVTTHRLHHAFTETDKDPHTPMFSWWYGHIGWIFRGTAQNQPDSLMNRYSPDLMKDPVHRVMNRWYWMSSVILALILFPIGGWGMLFWGIALRLVVGWHTTWLVNSWTHTWGSRRFDIRDTSTNSMFIALLTFGEGWHNNHHAYPRSSRHGLTWKEIDINWMQISVMKALGLFKEVYAIDLKKDFVEQDGALKKAA